MNSKLVLFLFSFAVSQYALSAPPNVVLIMADDLGYGELGCYGQTKIKTPNIDSIAKRGTKFTRYYSASPVCAPTRTSLMTGMHQGHASIRGNKEIGGWGLNEGEGQMSLPPSDITIAEVVRDQGYTTGGFGKWGLGAPGSIGHPLYQGFDSFFGYLCQRQAHNYFPTHLWNGQNVYLLTKNSYYNAHLKWESAPLDNSLFSQFNTGQYSPDEIDAQMVSFIGANKAKPFFVYVPSTLPHVALQAPKELVDTYPAYWDAAPYLGQNGYLPNLRPRATYAAMVTRFDQTVGTVIEQLKKHNLEGNTWIIVTSDNGTAPNGGCDAEFFNGAAGLRGLKTTAWEGGIRVPLIVVPPIGVKVTSEFSELACTYDLPATIAGITGGEMPANDGLDFSKVLTNERPSPRRQYLYFEFPENSGWQIVNFGRYKAIRPRTKQSLEIEIYDLELDRAETKNIATQHPDLVASAKAIMEKEHVPNADFPLGGVDTPVQPQN